jgi:hypothetical protein
MDNDLDKLKATTLKEDEFSEDLSGAVKKPRVAFVLQHLREDEDGYDNVKLLGVYSSLEFAEAAVERYKNLPGFVEHQEGFDISGYELDEDHWTEGFVDLSDHAGRG